MKQMKPMSSRSVILLFLAAGWMCAQTPGDPQNFYLKEIQPLLERNCAGCHNSKVKQGGLDMSTREALLRGSEHGSVVVPGVPNDSQLYKLVAHVTEPGMPFKGKKLPDEAIAKFAEWIKLGVPYGESAADPEAVSRADAAKHWAFRQPVRPQVPPVRDARWSRNP